MITAARYAEITGDTASAAVTVTARVEEAQELLEEYLDRPLASVERTETLYPDRRGRLWPKATPITDGGDYEVEGLALLSSAPLGYPSLINPDGGVAVTYTGGWTAGTLPGCIERDLARATYRLLHPSSLGSEVPVGATSVRLGDAAVSYGPGGAKGAGDTDAWWSKRTRSYRYAPVHSTVLA